MRDGGCTAERTPVVAKPGGPMFAVIGHCHPPLPLSPLARHYHPQSQSPKLHDPEIASGSRSEEAGACTGEASNPGPGSQPNPTVCRPRHISGPKEQKPRGCLSDSVSVYRWTAKCHSLPLHQSWEKLEVKSVATVCVLGRSRRLGRGVVHSRPLFGPEAARVQWAWALPPKCPCTNSKYR